ASDRGQSKAAAIQEPVCVCLLALYPRSRSPAYPVGGWGLPGRWGFFVPGTPTTAAYFLASFRRIHGSFLPSQVWPQAARSCNLRRLLSFSVVHWWCNCGAKSARSRALQVRPDVVPDFVG